MAATAVHEGRAAEPSATAVAPRLRRPLMSAGVSLAAALCAAVVVAYGLLALWGWAFGISVLKSPVARSVSTKGNSALLFLLAGVGLLIVALRRRRAWSHMIVLAAAGLVAALALITLVEYAFGVELGIDQLLFHEPAGAAATSSPGRMAPMAALSFVAAAVSLAALSAGLVRLGQLAATLVLVIGLSSLLGYMYGQGLTNVPRATNVSLYTAASLTALAAGLMLARAREGFMSTLTSDGVGGHGARRLLPVVLVALPLLGLLRRVGEQAGIYGPEFGVALMVLAALLILVPVIWVTAHRIDAVDIERSDALEGLRESERQLRRALEHLTRAQETERGRIAADVHDDALPALTAVSLQLELARDASASSVSRERLERAERELRGAAARLRHLVFELRPDVVEREGVSGALRHRLERLRTSLGIEYTLRDGLGNEGAPELRAMLYRVAIEALNNVAAHARASAVTVVLERHGQRAVLTITDDGVGMDSVEPRRGHLGLAMMRERAEAAGGGLVIHSAPGAGTTVEVSAPLEPEASIRSA